MGRRTVSGNHDFGVRGTPYIRKGIKHSSQPTSSFIGRPVAAVGAACLAGPLSCRGNFFRTVPIRSLNHPYNGWVDWASFAVFGLSPAALVRSAHPTLKGVSSHYGNKKQLLYGQNPERPWTRAWSVTPPDNVPGSPKFRSYRTWKACQAFSF